MKRESNSEKKRKNENQNPSLTNNNFQPTKKNLLLGNVDSRLLAFLDNEHKTTVDAHNDIEIYRDSWLRNVHGGPEIFHRRRDRCRRRELTTMAVTWAETNEVVDE
jgi:hypothetical protein